MGLLRRKGPRHSIPVHVDNLDNKDWTVMLEAGTIIGPSPNKLRVARATQERTIVKKYNIVLKSQHFLVIDGFNPRVHAVYFCPQLYRYDTDKKLVPLHGEEIGALIAKSIAADIADRQPWYEPSEQIPTRMIGGPGKMDFDTVVVEMPSTRGASS